MTEILNEDLAAPMMGGYRTFEESLRIILVFQNLEEGIRIGRMVNELSSVRCRVVEAGFNGEFVKNEPHLIFCDRKESQLSGVSGDVLKGKVPPITLDHLDGVFTAREKALLIHHYIEDFRKFFLQRSDSAQLPGEDKALYWGYWVYTRVRAWLRERQIPRIREGYEDDVIEHRIMLLGKPGSKFINRLGQRLTDTGHFLVKSIPFPQNDVSQIEAFEPELIVFPLKRVRESSRASHHDLRHHPALSEIPILYVVNSTSEGFIPFGSLQTSKNKAVVSRAEKLSTLVELIERKVG